jgi:hypothetical protein
MKIHFFTVFDRNYAARGLVMLESLRKASQQDVTTRVLALDDDAYRVASGVADIVMRVEDLGDGEFASLQGTRSHEEFCWTCAPVMSSFMVRTAAVGDFVVYVDADLYFFSDPAILLAEMGSDKNIIIHPHRFSPDRMAWEATAGKFNVGFVGFRVSEEAKVCTARWRAQVLDLCVKDPERGLCGDQGYLNEWPSLYPGLHVMEHIGGGTAPWNVNAYEVAGSASQPTVNNIPVVFFHFHQLRIVDCSHRKFVGVIHAIGYDFSEAIRRILYRKYVQRLRFQALCLDRSGIPLRSDLNYELSTFGLYLAGGQVSLAYDTFLDRIVFLLARLARGAVQTSRAARMQIPWFRSLVRKVIPGVVLRAFGRDT